ncbi:MAG: hypothetical protein IPK18_10900 [Sphingobacteriales bacterium]|jgi:hypothetical protein|nr:MAG: hypothetical protein IPK18_10900 [Sphingobacteriales bacterium]
MKYIVIVCIALGLILSLIFGIEYNCDGQEIFPTYFGSPFVFKQESLGSSMEYYFSILGLIFNVFIWSIVLVIVDYYIRKVINKLYNKTQLKFYYISLVGVLVVYSSIIIILNMTTVGHGFKKELNYWYWNVDDEAEKWNVECEGKFIYFNIF